MSFIRRWHARNKRVPMGKIHPKTGLPVYKQNMLSACARQNSYGNSTDYGSSKEF